MSVPRETDQVTGWDSPFWRSKGKEHCQKNTCTVRAESIKGQRGQCHVLPQQNELERMFLLLMLVSSNLCTGDWEKPVSPTAATCSVRWQHVREVRIPARNAEQSQAKSQQSDTDVSHSRGHLAAQQKADRRASEGKIWSRKSTAHSANWSQGVFTSLSIFPIYGEISKRDFQLSTCFQ